MLILGCWTLIVTGSVFGEQVRGERERFERLARKASEAYMKVLRRPADEHHHKVEEAKADLEEASQS
jgi:hypothetical protein